MVLFMVTCVRSTDRIDTGMVWINRATWTEPDLPFGVPGHGADRSHVVIASRLDV